MQTRFHMDNGIVMVEDTKREALEAIRKTDPRFKGRRIKSVCQAYPSLIKVGVVYEMGYDNSPNQVVRPA